MPSFIPYLGLYPNSVNLVVSRIQFCGLEKPFFSNSSGKSKTTFLPTKEAIKEASSAIEIIESPFPHDLDRKTGFLDKMTKEQVFNL